jgi:hypothetical protein
MKVSTDFSFVTIPSIRYAFGIDVPCYRNNACSTFETQVRRLALEKGVRKAIEITDLAAIPDITAHRFHPATREHPANTKYA